MSDDGRPRSPPLRLAVEQTVWLERIILVAGTLTLVGVVAIERPTPTLAVRVAHHACVALSLLVARRFARLALRQSVVVASVLGYGVLWGIVLGPRPGVGAVFVSAALLATVFFRGRGGAIATLLVGAAVACVGIVTVQGWTSSLQRPAPSLQLDLLQIVLGTSLTVAASGVTTARISSDIRRAYERTTRALDVAQREEREHARARRALLASAQDEALGKLAGGIAHDVNNGLAVILANAEVLVELEKATSERARLAREIVEAARRAASTTRDVLALGRPQPESATTSQATELLPRLASFLERAAPPDVSVGVTCAASFSIGISPDQLQRIVLLLALDGLESLTDGGSLRISCAADDAGVRARIELGFLARNLGPELRAWRDERLAALRATLARSGGELDVETAPGSARVTLVLPFGQPASADEGPARTAKSTVTRVLVVDDEAPVRKAIARVLRTAGHDVVEAGDGASALREFQCAAGFDLLLTDAIMPGTDTEALIRAFRDRHPPSAVVVCSGYVADDVLGELSEEDYDFVGKPFTQEALLGAVERALSRRVVPTEAP